MHHRKANGPQTYRTPARRANDIASSILAHQAAGRERTMADYGIVDAEMIVLVETALAKMTEVQAA